MTRILYPGEERGLRRPLGEQVVGGRSGLVQKLFTDVAGDTAHGRGHIEEGLFEDVLVTRGYGRGDQDAHGRSPARQSV